MPEKFQTSFVGGMNQKVNSIRLNETEYPLLVNARNRYDDVRPVKLPMAQLDVEIRGAKQGGIEVGSTVILFVEGRAYFKDFSFEGSVYQQVPGLLMDPNAPTIWAAAVSASSLNFSREPVATDGNKKTQVKLITAINSSPQVIVVQDGFNQPWGIFPDMTARQLQNFQEWSLDSREYVPIGREMLFKNGKLYIVLPDRKTIAHSVTGRPLDFIIQITNDGNKVSPEEVGGAISTSHKVDFDDITCIADLNVENGGFLVATENNSYIVIPVLTPEELIFGEPTFRNQYLFSAGMLNNFSFIELIGDNAFIDKNGFRSFNAIQYYNTEGNNSPFSQQLGPVIQGIEQTITAAKNFDNYAFFACETIYGPGIVLYDTLTEIFVGLDLYPGVGLIKQFFEIKTDTRRRLFFIDDEDNFYEAFGGGTATCGIYIGDWASNNPAISQKTSHLKLVLSNIREPGELQVECYVDKKLGVIFSKQLEANFVAETTLAVPFGTSSADTLRTISFDFGRALLGWRAGFWITWTCDAVLSSVSYLFTEARDINSTEEKVKDFKNLKTTLS